MNSSIWCWKKVFDFLERAKKPSSLTDVLFLSCLQLNTGTLSSLLKSCFLKAAMVFSKPSLVKTDLSCAEVAPVMKSRTVSFEEGNGIAFIVIFTASLRDLCTVSAFVLSTRISLSCVEIFLVWAWSAGNVVAKCWLWNSCGRLWTTKWNKNYSITLRGEGEKRTTGN